MQQHTAIRLYLTFHLYLIAQLITALLLVESNIKRRTFIVLHANIRSSLASFQRKHPIQTSGWQCKIDSKRAEFIGTNRFLSNFLIICIHQNNSIVLVRKYICRIRFLYIGNSFHIYGLTGTVQRTVRQQSHSFGDLVFISVISITSTVNALKRHTGIDTFSSFQISVFGFPGEDNFAICPGCIFLQYFFVIRIKSYFRIRYRVSRLSIQRHYLILISR